MQLNTIVLTLLVPVAQGRRHHYSLLAADPPGGATCYRGNQKQYPVSGSSTPPCWYAQPDDSYSCYEFDPKINQCPKFLNKVNKPDNDNNSATSFRGNQKQYLVSGKSTPPCWYKEADGSNSCYEYEPSTRKCLSFPNPISKPTFHLRTHHHENECKCYSGNMRDLEPVADPENKFCWYEQYDKKWACFAKIDGKCPF